jgi:hypothetical protein
MPTPGAAMSGLPRAVPAAGPVSPRFCQTTGPRLEKLATVPVSSIAATESADG